MNDSPYIIRNYNNSDYNDYVKLHIEATNLNPVSPYVSPQTISEELKRPGYSPEKDLYIAELAGEITGFMNLTPELETERVILECAVHPQHRRKGIANKLVDYATHRTKELGAKSMRVNIQQENTVAIIVLARLGFRAARQFLEMRILLPEAKLPEIPSGTYSCRHMHPGEEAQLTQIQNSCFGGAWEYNPNTTNDIIYYLSLSHRSPEDIILVCEGEKPIGYCWTELSPEDRSEKKGRIRMFGIDPDYRRQGAGKKVLLAGLAYLKSKEVQAADLTVDGENKTACAIYQSMGFKQWASSLWYEKIID